MYFVFMLSKSSSSPPHLRHNSNRLHIVIGILNVGLVLHVSVSAASIITIVVALLTPFSKLEGFESVHWMPRVSLHANLSELAQKTFLCSLRLQTALHSILSTRIVLHTTTVLRQDITESRAAVAQDRSSDRMEVARDTTIEIVAE